MSEVGSQQPEHDGVGFTTDAWERTSRVVRWAEAMMAKYPVEFNFEPEVSARIPVQVEVTGGPVEYGPDILPGGSGATGSPGATGSGNPPAVLYEGQIITKIDGQTDPLKMWHRWGKCWVREMAGRDLLIGEPYLGILAEQHLGRALIDVKAGGVDCGGGGSGGTAGTPMDELIQCVPTGGSGTETMIRPVRLGVPICGIIYPVRAYDDDGNDVTADLSGS